MGLPYLSCWLSNILVNEIVSLKTMRLWPVVVLRKTEVLYEDLKLDEFLHLTDLLRLLCYENLMNFCISRVRNAEIEIER